MVAVAEVGVVAAEVVAVAMVAVAKVAGFAAEIPVVDAEVVATVCGRCGPCGGGRGGGWAAASDCVGGSGCRGLGRLVLKCVIVSEKQVK